MKTSKLKYVVTVYKDEGYEFLSQQIGCITLAEARLEASRYPYTCICPTGVIFYQFGKEIDEKKVLKKS